MKLRLISTFALALTIAACDKREPATTTTTADATAKDAAVSVKDDSFILATAENLPVAVGRTLTFEMAMNLADAKMALDMNGQSIEGTVKQTSVEGVTIEMLSATKAKHRITQSKQEGSATVNGQEQPNPQEINTLIDVPVIVEKTGDAWVATLETGTPTAEQETDLEEITKQYQTRQDLAIYGAEKRKPGDKWSVDPAKLPSFAGAEQFSGTFEVEFKEVKEIDGVPCGIFTYQFDLSGKAEDKEGAPEMAISFKGSADVTRSLRDLADIGVTFNALTALSGEAGPGITMKISGDTKMTLKGTAK